MPEPMLPLYHGIHFKMIFTWKFKITIPKLCLEFIQCKSHPYLPMGNELNTYIWARVNDEWTYCWFQRSYIYDFHLHNNRSTAIAIAIPKVIHNTERYQCQFTQYSGIGTLTLPGQVTHIGVSTLTTSGSGAGLDGAKPLYAPILEYCN